ncbi:CinA family protein [Alkalihalophilus lindianensis]|uniref:CinA family protein n=1 Tax=Alkalihalophilus lindianensis TaxID=1630542 RepID=A0ABU3XHR0_9BACI|nr:CinA family protein [Alkalihalophilus lindianensis]MDV2687432.1 CinA family protein [Alkalihalophilus lindianensis]
MEGKPVGTVYIGISIKGRPTNVEKITLGGSRAANRERAVKFGCYFLIRNLRESQNAE